MMAKVKTEIGNDYCPQALFLYGTKQEDGQPHFGLFCWFGYYHSSEGLGVMACIGEEKQTKDLIRKNGVFSANLVSEQLLPLADYYGCTCGRTTPNKMQYLPAIEQGQVLDTTIPFTERLMQAAPVLAPGDGTYSSIDGRYLGKWGEPMKNMANTKE